MAVVKLNLLTVTGRAEHFEETFSLCAAEKDFSFVNAGELLGGVGRGAVQGEINPYTTLLTRADALAAGLELTYDTAHPPAFTRAADLAALDDEALSAQLERWQAEFNALHERREELASAIREDERILTQLGHLVDTEVDVDDLVDFQFFKCRFGHMPRDSYDSLSAYRRVLDDFIFLPSQIEPREVWGMYFAPRARQTKVDALFASLHFQRVRFSERIHGKPRDAYAGFEAEIAAQREEMAQTDAKLAAFRTEKRDGLLTICEELLRRDKLFSMRGNAYLKGEDFTITGWAPAQRTKAIRHALEEISTVTCTYEKASQVQGIQPPTTIRNAPIFRPFEQFVEMYGLPAYNELDPTPFVALTYILFFGLMFGDVGQGAVLILAGLAMWFLKRVNLGRIIALCGISSIGFGFFYGSIFGFEDIIHGFNPMENINTTLFAAVAIGIVMIVAVMALNITNGIRQRSVKKVLLSPNGVAGLVLYLTAVVVVLGVMGILEGTVPTAPLVVLIVAMLLLLFFAEPLTLKLEHRKRTEPVSALDFVLENFFELFEVVLSFLTNTISFIRIGAFALSHVGMMTVVFLLAETAAGTSNPIVLVFGNLFVVGFEGLIVGIQVLRLEFYELFGRFYAGTGHAPDVRMAQVLGKKH